MLYGSNLILMLFILCNKYVSFNMKCAFYPAAIFLLLTGARH
jgi:hypothetical protein